MSLILKSSDHVTQARNTQESISMNLVRTAYGAQESVLTAQSYSLHRLYLGLCSR